MQSKDTIKRREAYVEYYKNMQKRGKFKATISKNYKNSLFLGSEKSLVVSTTNLIKKGFTQPHASICEEQESFSYDKISKRPTDLTSEATGNIYVNCYSVELHEQAPTDLSSGSEGNIYSSIELQGKLPKVPTYPTSDPVGNIYTNRHEVQDEPHYI